MDCGKICLSERQARAHVLASDTYRRAYYCKGCRCWHTTSQQLPYAQEAIQYRHKTKGPTA